MEEVCLVLTGGGKTVLYCLIEQYIAISITIIMNRTLTDGIYLHWITIILN